MKYLIVMAATLACHGAAANEQPYTIPDCSPWESGSFTRNYLDNHAFPLTRSVMDYGWFGYGPNTVSLGNVFGQR